MIGYNIDGLFTTNEQKSYIVNHYKTKQPRLAVVLNNVPLAQQIKNVSPNTTVIVRKTFGNEHDNIWKVISPERFFEIYADIAKTDLYAYSSNEPSLVDEYIQWEIKVAKIAIQRDLKVCVGNFSVGTPDYRDYYKLHELFYLAIKHPKNVTLGLHEYCATNWYELDLLNFNPKSWNLTGMYETHLMGRYKHINSYCRKHFNNLPKIAITEWGFDTIFSHIDKQSQMTGFRIPMGIDNCYPKFFEASYQYGISNWYYYTVLQLQTAWNTLYRESNIIGQALFCFGGNGIWGDVYNFADNNYMLNVLEGFKQNVVITNEIKRGTKINNVQYTGDVVLRFRKEPNLNASAWKSLIKGEKGYMYTDSYAEYDGYTWKRFLFLVNGGLETGWCAVSVNGASFVNIG